MRVVVVSDTHMRHEALDLPAGDVLVHAGDCLGHGTLAELDVFARFFANLPHQHKILIAGNHDWAFEREPARARALLGPIHYLQDDGACIGGVQFWGSPWQPDFLGWAFNLPRGAPLAERWACIPDRTDVLITHGPPHRIGDRTFDGSHAGCEALRVRVEQVGPRYHVFGHIHEGYGVYRHAGTIFVNASSCDLGYRPSNPPVVLDLPEPSAGARR